MGLSLKSLLPIAGAAAAMFVPGMQAFGANMAMNAALGSGIGTLLAGGDINDAVKNAVLGGITGGGLQGMGVQGAASQKAIEAAASASGMGMGEGVLAKAGYGQMGAGGAAAGQAAATKAATSGIASMLTPGNLMLAGLAGGLLAEEPEQPELTELERRQMETGERLPGRKGRDVVGELDYDTNQVRYSSPSYATGGYIQGPGSGTSDSIKSGIYQNGMKVQEARLSDGEFVFTERAVRGLGNGDRAKGAAKMYEMMRQYERMA